MPVWFVSEPFLNLWLVDTPLEYTSAFGAPIKLRLAYNQHHVGSVTSLSAWHGAEFGNVGGSQGVWSCSWLSFAELSSDESTVDLMAPAGGWATFSFPTNSNISSINYRKNLWLEKQGPAGGITNLILHRPNGSQTAYEVSDPTNAATHGLAGLFYMSSTSDPAGNQTTFAYNTNFYLTNVTAADGATFTLQYNQPLRPDAVTSIASSYGASVSFGYQDLYGPVLTNITDAAGISSQIAYVADTGLATQLITPYGTTQFSIYGNNGNNGVFDRTLEITNATGTVEFYGLMNTYTGTSWPDFAASQIPTNTPLGTLDSDPGGRPERNTFYWNAQQFASYLGLLTNLNAFDWPQFKTGRIRHWLTSTFKDYYGAYYTHFDTLSVEQAPSPDGTSEGQLTWYDYANKPAGADYEIGSQIVPSVIARVMPDGTTWYQYYQRLTNGYPTQMVEHWVDGVNEFRTNTYVYATNNADMLAWTNAVGVLAMSNVFNAYHQVVTNYDALNQMTTCTYDSTTHELTSILSPAGLTTTNIYDGTHHLQKTINLEINRTNTFTWNSDGTMYSHTDERGLTTTNFWDGLHRLTSVLYPDGTTTSNRYDVISGNSYPNSSGGTATLDLTGTKDRMGFWTYYAYDAIRRCIFETNANNFVTAYGYCDCGSISSTTNALGTAVQQVTTYTHDYQGNLIYIYNADSYNVTNWFDALGRTITIGDGTGYRYFNYNNLSLLTSVTNLCGIEQTSVYDLLDRPVYVTDANGVTITNTYDNLNRPTSRGYPDGGVEHFGYSARGLIAYTNQLAFTNLYVYDAAGRKTFETNALNQSLRYTNNAAGDLLSLTDGKTNTTRWKYDEYGRVTNKFDQAGNVILKYIYDPDSRLTNRWSWAFGNTAYKYDPLANLTNIAYPHSGTVKLQYDPPPCAKSNCYPRG
jgi:YD repeat-containing protein